MRLGAAEEAKEARALEQLRSGFPIKIDILYIIRLQNIYVHIYLYELFIKKIIYDLCILSYIYDLCSFCLF